MISTMRVSVKLVVEYAQKEINTLIHSKLKMAQDMPDKGNREAIV